MQKVRDLGLGGSLLPEHTTSVRRRAPPAAPRYLQPRKEGPAAGRSERGADKPRAEPPPSPAPPQGRRGGP